MPAAAALAVFVAGAELPADALRTLEPLDDLVAAGLLERAGDRVRASVAVMPLGSALLVCDRHDAADTDERVCWPDDSSYHLATAIAAGRRARWLDLACGLGVRAARPPRARRARSAASISTPAPCDSPRLGAALPAAATSTLAEADIGEPQRARCARDVQRADPRRSRRGDLAPRRTASFFARMWPAARACIAPGGEIVVHTTFDAVPARPRRASASPWSTRPPESAASR